MPLRDVFPASRPNILFVGINPSLRSEALGHHYAGRGNPFWRLVFASRLSPVPLTFEDDARMAEWGMGLTNLCPRATRAASDLTRDDLEEGRALLTEKIRRRKPKLVALVGVTLYAQVLGASRTGEKGPGLKPDRIHGARVFVLPNPSGLNASYPSFDDKLVWFKALRTTARRTSSSSSRRSAGRSRRSLGTPPLRSPRP